MYRVKDDIAKNGGQITKEFSLIKAFAYVDLVSCHVRTMLIQNRVTMPEGLVGTFENHGSVSHVEKDQTVTTQSPNP